MNKSKRREELEKMLEYCPKEEAELVEEDGEIIKKVTPLQSYRLMKSIGKFQKVQGQFLLYLDDRITEQNGYHDSIKKLQEEVSQICNERETTCPVIPIVEKLKSNMTEHLDGEAEKKLAHDIEQALISKWKEKGAEEEQERYRLEEARFRRKMSWIGAIVSIITVSIAVLSFLLGVWSW